MDSTPPERPIPPITFLAAAGWTLLVKLLFEISLGLLESVHPGALTDLVTVTAARVLAVSFVLFVILRVHEPESSLRMVLAVRRTPIAVLLLAVIAGAALALPASWLGSLVADHLPKPEETDAYARLFSTETTARRAILLASLVFVMPISDELFFRGALFTPLKRDRRADVVVLATAAYDALLNFNPRGVASFLFVLLALGWIRAVTGSVVPSVLARVAFFAVLVVPEALGKPEPPTTPAYLAGAVGVAVLALGAIAALSRRAARVVEASAVAEAEEDV